jgi:DNA-binding response OmpR family regulator
MFDAKKVPTQVLLVEIEKPIAAQLVDILRREEQPFRIAPLKELSAIRMTTGNLTRRLVFCGAQRQDTLDFLHSIEGQAHAPSVVVVTPTFDFKHWLDVLEAGATDYCAFPLEEAHIQWILNKARLAESQSPK